MLPIVHRSPIVRNWAPCWFALVAGALSGCATVDPKPDFENARARITERTGFAEVFDPTADEYIEAKIDELLADGLTVDEATRVALLNNRDFQVRFREIGVSRADVVQSALLSNPTLALGFNFPEGGGLVDFTLGIAQQIADLWQIPIRKRAAEKQLERTILEAGRAAVELIAQVRTQCYDVIALQRARRLAEENVGLSQRIVDVARRRFEAGQVSEFDVDLTRATLLDIEADAIATRGALETARAKLADLLGLNRRRVNWALVDELPDSNVALSDDDALLMQALDQRMDAVAALMDADAAKDELALQIRRVFPDVQIGVAFEQNEQRAIPGRKILADTARASISAGALTAPTIESRGQRRLVEDQIIKTKLGPALSLTLPIWDQNQAQIAKARFRAEQARTQYARVLDRIALEVESAAIKSRISWELIHLHRDESVPLADVTLRGATQLYEAGERDVLSLVDAQENLVKRRRDLVNAMRDYAVAIAQLESAVGGQLPLPMPVHATSQPVGSEPPADESPDTQPSVNATDDGAEHDH